MAPSFQTIRVSNLPPTTTARDVQAFFEYQLQRTRGRPIIDKVGPLSTYGDQPFKRTTVTLWTTTLAQKALSKLQGHPLRPAAGGDAREIRIDRDFSDLTILYTPHDHESNADFVAVHGLDSHAWTAFSTTFSHDHGSKEYMWLRDTLPEYMQASGIYPRVMTYGWNANVWIDASNTTTTDAAVSLVRNIDAVREERSTKPLFFLGHSLGGVVVKQAVNEMVDVGMAKATQDNAPAYESPVKGCFFFATPHLGSGLAEDYATLLSILKTVFILKNAPSNVLVKELRPKGEEFARISMQFDATRSAHDIKTISCFEQKFIHGQIVVPKESAVLDYDLNAGRLPHNAYPVDADHREIVRFSSAEHPSFSAIMSAVKTIMQAALHPHHETGPATGGTEPISPPVDTNIEPILANLKRFDTIFLVDDSASMDGPRWRLAREALTAVVDRAVRYDTNGVDIRFLNDKDHRGDNLKTAAQVMHLFDRVRPEGVTPMEEAIDDELNGYMVRYKERGRAMKKLNLIVLTDGEPNEDDDVEGMIVRYAEELDRERAKTNQVGIQFVQIGDDRKAARFLKMLDDDLKTKHDLKRDMVDTVQWNSAKFKGKKLYEKILLGGILTRVDNDEEDTVPDVAGLGIQ